jgi:hypothetical protein
MRWSLLLICAVAVTSLGFATPITVPAGDDPFHIQDVIVNLLIPGDHFEPGSDPFNAAVAFQGLPQTPGLPPSNAGLQFSSFFGFFHFGPFTVVAPIAPGPDTIVRRTTPIGPLPDGGSATVPIELVALELKSVAPITVTHADGQADSFFDVFIELDLPQPGSLTLNRTGATNGGTFTAGFQVQPRLTFVRIGAGPQPQPLFISDTLLGGGTWEVQGADPIPEPATWLLAAAGLTLLAARRARCG